LTWRAAFLGLITFLFVLLFPSKVFSTPDYARQTGKDCRACHLNPRGGGELTREGQAFREQLRIKGLYRPWSLGRRLMHLFIGYIHLLTAILWFGTILYVHLLLKPSYAARGLPRGELWLGWVSIVVMAVTGTLLTMERIPSWDILFHTRFGLLLLVKISLFLVMVSTALLVTFVIGPKLKKRKQQVVPGHRNDLTLEEIAHFDGKGGRPAYVAYQGKIYNMTQSGLWQEGWHMGKHPAGSDLTDMLKQAPHGEDKILSMPTVGKLLAPGMSVARRPEVKIFYFFAYLNLVLVFLIIFVIALWRWW
jgi:predicted heme/steroid binding protein/uncharacterized membrane protein